MINSVSGEQSPLNAGGEMSEKIKDIILNKKFKLYDKIILIYKEVDKGKDWNSLSKVLDLASKGTIAGPIDIEEKKIVIPTNPLNNCSKGRFLPIKKAKKRKKGINKPKITTGPLL